MPMLEVGNMDSIKTKAEAMPAQKKVRVQVQAPQSAEDKKNEVYKDPNGNFTMAKFTLKIVEGPFTGRYVKLSVFSDVNRTTYLSWNLQKEGRPMTEVEKSLAHENRDFLKDLKRFGEACDVDFATQATEDTYGKELYVDITQKIDKEDDTKIYNEARNPKKI